MQNYDAVLKQLLQGPGTSVLKDISGSTVRRWLPTEQPKVESRRMDLLGESDTGELIHIELQSNNDPQMGLRMAEYLLDAYRRYGRFARQTVLYVGEPALSMPRGLTGGSLSFEYTLVDIREFDAEKLSESPWLSDNIIAILGRLGDRRKVLQRVLARIATLDGELRGVALRQFSILAGLRRLGTELEEEVKHMPILSDMMDHDLFGPLIQQGIQRGIQQGMEQGMEQGIQRGIQQGMEQGIQQGMREIVRHQIEKRFGLLPSGFERRFAELTAPQLDELALRILEAETVEDLFR